MDLIFTILKYIGLGFAGFFGLIILIFIFFGKRVEKQWEVRADFKGPNKRDVIGKFEVEKRRIAKEETDFRLQAKCNLSHSALRAVQPVRVTVGEVVAMEGKAQQDGRLRLRNDAWTGNIEALQPGATVTVWVGNEALASAELFSDFATKPSIIKDDASHADVPRTARILKKSSAKPAGFALVIFGLVVGYFAWRQGVAPVGLGLLGLFPLLGVYLALSNTINILYIDNGNLGWYSRFNRQLHAGQVPIGDIQSLIVKPYRFGRRGGYHYQVVIGLTDGYEVLMPNNLFGANVVRYVEKHLVPELRNLKPSIEYIEEEGVYGKPKNRFRLPAGSK